MSAIDLLADPAPFRALTQQYPHGLSFKHANATAVREIVSILQDRIRELGLRLKLRVEPLHFPSGNTQGVSCSAPAPTRLTIQDQNLRWGIPLECAEQFLFLDERVIATARPDGITRVVNAIVTAIKTKLHA